LFAVFDGHGGSEVAKYSEKHFPKILLQSDLYKKKDYKEAMRRGFLKVDESLNEGGLSEVAEMKRKFPPTKSPLLKLLT
jgi:serine/threonine protein phosphatase PrpC